MTNSSLLATSNEAVHREAWEGAATVIAPRERMRPSDWCERNFYITRGEHKGLWRRDLHPWQSGVLDAIVDCPDKRGAALRKCVQVGGTTIFTGQQGWKAVQRPDDMLYLTSKDDAAQDYVHKRWEPMVENCAVLKQACAGFQSKKGKRGEREKVLRKPYRGGCLTLAGGQSVTNVMSTSYPFVDVDEYDTLPEYKNVGDALKTAEGRTRAYKRSWINVWSTPREVDEGIDRVYKTQSDMRRFFVDCPHCEGEQWLTWEQVRNPKKPAAVYYECEHCGEAITDAQRRRMVHGGRWRSTLPEEEAQARPYAGFSISRLYDGSIPLAELSAMFALCKTEAQLRNFYNNELGEAYSAADNPLTRDTVMARARRPGDDAPADARFIVAGVDVQQSARVFVLDVSAYDSHGVRHLLDYPIIRGKEALFNYLRSFRRKAGDRVLGIHGLCIDSGDMTQAVYEMCDALGNSWAIPVRYEKTGIPKGEFWNWRKLRNTKTREGKARRVMFLDRGYWMDRAIGRFGGGEELASVMLPNGISHRYVNEILAPRRLIRVNEFGNRKVSWETPDEKRDDYAHAAVYTEVAAVIAGLDKMDEETEAIVERSRRALAAARPEVEGEDAHVQRMQKYARRKGGWFE